MKLTRKLAILFIAAALLTGAGAAAQAEAAPEEEATLLIEQPLDSELTDIPEEDVEITEEPAETAPVVTIQPSVFAFPGVSEWAQPEVFTLFSRDSVPESLMSDFTTSITRAEFTAIISRAYEEMTGEEAPSDAAGFTDIHENPYAESIMQAYNLGIINGRSDTSFDPDSYISRQEAAKILYSFLSVLQKAQPLTDSQPPFADAADITGWAVPYVAYAYNNGLMEGTNTGFEPLGTLTREQAMAIIERMWAGIEGGSTAEADPIDPIYRAVTVGMADYANESYDGERFAVAVDEYMEKLPYLQVNGKTYEVTPIMNMLKDDLFAQLDAIFGQADEDDVSLLFLSGHGTKTHKIAMTDSTTDEMHDFSVIIEAMSKYNGTKVLIVGNCYSGCLIPMSADDDSIVVITSCAADEESYGVVTDYETYNVFERAVLQALHFDNGFNADYNGDGIVYSYELAAFLKVALANTIKGAESTVHYKPGRGAIIATGILETISE